MIATDSELLMRFTRHQDEGAFEQLVQKHASLVLGTCRQVLRNEHDVEDAFQATFLILLRRYHTIRKKNSVASWLYGVAYRTAMRAARRKRNHAEQPLLEDPVMDSDPFDVIRDRELCNALNEELSTLPDRYQDVLVLCYLEGKSQSQAAEELDCTEPAVKARLARGRRLLRMRMIRRGLALSTAVTAANMAISAASASTTSLTQQAVASCLSYAATGHVAGSCTTHAVTLSEQGVKAMTVSSFAKPTVAAIGIAIVAFFCTFGLNNGITAATPDDDAAGEDVISIVTTTDDEQPAAITLTAAVEGGEQQQHPNLKHKRFFEYLAPGTKIELGSEKNGNQGAVLVVDEAFVEMRRIESERYRNEIAVGNKSWVNYEKKFREYVTKHHPEHLKGLVSGVGIHYGGPKIPKGV